MRHSQRANNEIRNIELVPGFNPYAEGSCLVKFGGTHVICTAQRGRESAGVAEGGKTMDG